MPPATSSHVAVSVVVPVYNPGPHVDRCVSSLVSQSMSPEDYEVVFVDDGSTDGTGERLDEVAAEHANVVVMHQPNSGWPGKPRNVGIDAARGEYVFFCDHDDELSPRALDRMVAMARRTGADVLIPKMVGHNRRVPRGIFRTNVDAVALTAEGPLASLTPHKLFRRDFLDTHGLRFPEGKRRLEDHVFVVHAYLHANVISILADYPCYHHFRREDAGNAGYEKWDASYYYGFVGEVLDVIDRHTEPGPMREELLYRPYRVEMLGRLFAERINRWDPESRVEIFDNVRRLALTRFPAGFHERFHAAPRAHATAVVANDFDRLTDVAQRSGAVIARPTIRNLAQSRGGWTFDVEAELVHADGSPVRLIPAGEGWRLDPRLIPHDLQPERYDTDDLTRVDVDVLVQHRSQHVRWYAETSLRPELVEIPDDPDGARRLVVRGVGALDPASVAGGRRLGRGDWEVHLHAEIFGILRMTPAAPELPIDRAPLLLAGSRSEPFTVTPHVGAKGRLVFQVRTVAG